MPFGYGTAGRGRRASRPTVRRTVEMLEQRDLLALVVGPLVFTEDIPLSGRVATFAASDLQGTITDFKPSITWGDGTTTTTASIVPNGATSFDVLASKTYAQFGSFPVTVTVTGTSNSSVFGMGTAPVADAPLTPASPTSFTATSGQLFNGAIGSFQDVNSTSTGNDFTVTVDWGDGEMSLGSASPASAGQTGTIRYNVSGSHVYATTGNKVVKATVVRTTSGQSVTTTSTGNILAPVLTPTGFTVSGTPNQPLSNVALAELVDSSTTSTAADFVATIQWGPGLPTTVGTVTAVAGSGANTTVPGRFHVSGTFTYPASGTYHPIITVVRTTLGQSVSTNATVEIAAPTLVVVGTSINPSVGVQFQGNVASFTDTIPGGMPSDFTASINWGSGQSTLGKVEATTPGHYDVSGTFTFNVAGPTTSTVTVTRTAGGQQASASTAVIVSPAFTNVPLSGITATVGQPFSGPVANFIDGQSGSRAADFTATLDWGDGQFSSGAVVAVQNAVGTYNVYGSHSYSVPGHFPVHTTIVRSSNGQTVSASVIANVFILSGGLDPLSFSSQIGTTSVTNQEEPILTGTAEPRSAVSLSIRRVGGGDPLFIGETVADSTGRWSLVVGPLAGAPFYLYGVAAPTTGPPSPITPLNNGQPILVDLQPIHITAVFMGPSANRLTMMVRGDKVGADPVGLSQAGSYTLLGADGRMYTPTSVRVAHAPRSNPTAPRAVTLTFGRSTFAHGGPLTLRVASRIATVMTGQTAATVSFAVHRRRLG